MNKNLPLQPCLHWDPLGSSGLAQPSSPCLVQHSPSHRSRSAGRLQRWAWPEAAAQRERCPERAGLALATVLEASPVGLLLPACPLPGAGTAPAPPPTHTLLPAPPALPIWVLHPPPTLPAPSCLAPSPPRPPSTHGSIVGLLGDLQLTAPGSASLPPSSVPRAGRELHLSLSFLKGPISSAGSPGCSASSSFCWHGSAAATAAASPGHVIPVPSSLGSCHSPPLPMGREAHRVGCGGCPGVAAAPTEPCSPWLGPEAPLHCGGLVVPAQSSPWDHEQTPVQQQPLSQARPQPAQRAALGRWSCRYLGAHGFRSPTAGQGIPAATERVCRTGLHLPAESGCRVGEASPAPPSRRCSRSNRLRSPGVAPQRGSSGGGCGWDSAAPPAPPLPAHAEWSSVQN